MLLDRPHPEVVRDDGPVVAELPAKEPGDGAEGERRREPVVERAIEDVRGHDAVRHPLVDQGAVGDELDVRVRGGRDVHEALVRVAIARAVAGEVLERGQHPLVAHAAHEGAGVRGDEERVRAEAPRGADDHGVGGVVPDVHDGREVPVDPGRAQHARDAAGLELGEREVVGLAELLGGERPGEARAGREPHDLPALGVHGDEERPARAGARARLQGGGEPRELLRVHDVAREEYDAAHPRLAQERLERRVALELGALEAHEEELAQLGLEGEKARGVERGSGPAAGDERDEEEASGGEPRQRASPRAPDPPAGARRPRPSRTCRRSRRRPGRGARRRSRA